VHRDLKTGNLLVGLDNTVKVRLRSLYDRLRASQATDCLLRSAWVTGVHTCTVRTVTLFSRVGISGLAEFLDFESSDFLGSVSRGWVNSDCVRLRWLTAPLPLISMLEYETWAD
jgi:hypothetical protein